MGFSEFITGFIVFTILLLLLHVIRLFAIPLDIGLPSLPPVPITSTIWNVFLNVTLIFLAIVLTAFFVLYLVYKAIEKMIKPIPIFGTIIWAIVSNITPFKELKSSGVFGLFDALIGIVGSGFSGASFRRAGQAIADFLSRSIGLARSKLRFGGRQINLPGGGLPGGSGGLSGSATTTENKEGEVLTQSQQFQVRDEFVKCMRENMASSNPKDPIYKQRLVDLKNQLVRSQCQSQNVGTYMKLMMASKF